MTAERADFGARLRAAREARGLSLKDIAAATKISPLTLEALERNDARRLPGGLFSRAFVRAYAHEVGLDPEQTVREFVERFADRLDGGIDQPMHVHASSGDIDGPASRSGVRWLGLGITIVLVIAWISVDRYFSSRVNQEPKAPRSAASSDLPQPPAPPPIQRAAPAAAPPIETAPASPTAPAGVQPTPAQPAPAKPSPGPPGTEQGEPAAAPPAPAAPPQATEAEPAATTPSVDPTQPLQIVLSAQSPCWVSVSVDGKRIAGRTLQPGERLPLSAGKAVVLTAGDAGALSYTVNDAPGRSLGAAGQSVTVVISVSNYKTYVAGRQ